MDRNVILMGLSALHLARVAILQAEAAVRMLEDDDLTARAERMVKEADELRMYLSHLYRVNDPAHSLESGPPAQDHEGTATTADIV